MRIAIERRRAPAGSTELIEVVTPRTNAAIITPAEAMHAYLLGFMWWLGMTLGCMALLFTQFLTGGSWGMVLRRILEAASRCVCGGMTEFLCSRRASARLDKTPGFLLVARVSRGGATTPLGFACAHAGHDPRRPCCPSEQGRPVRPGPDRFHQQCNRSRTGAAGESSSATARSSRVSERIRALLCDARQPCWRAVDDRGDWAGPGFGGTVLLN